MTSRSKNVAIPLLIIALGVGWLLTTRQIIPGVDWIWVLCLGITGLLTFIVGGFNKVTLVVGPFLIISTAFSLLRQTGRLELNTEVPALVILLGILLLIVQVFPVPNPAWLSEPPVEQR